MSYKATHWAWETDLPMTQKFVLVALADMADEAHSCFPGQERIARMIGATDRTVRAALTKLEADGFLTRIERRGSDGLRTSDRYVLHVNRKMLPVVESPEDDDRVTGISRRSHRKEIPGNHQRTTREPSDLLSPGEPDDLGTLIPDGWRPNQKHVDKAASLRLDVKYEYQRFRAHAERTHRRLKSWNTGFTNWLRKSAEMNQQRGGAPARQTFAQQKQNNMLSMVERLELEEQQREALGSSQAPDIRGIGRGSGGDGVAGGDVARALG